jgi:hypothetical protein
VLLTRSENAATQAFPPPPVLAGSPSSEGAQFGSVSNILYIVAGVVGFAFVAVVVNEMWKRYKNSLEEHREEERRSRYEYASRLPPLYLQALHQIS